MSPLVCWRYLFPLSRSFSACKIPNVFVSCFDPFCAPSVKYAASNVLVCYAGNFVILKKSSCLRISFFPTIGSKLLNPVLLWQTTLATHKKKMVRRIWTNHAVDRYPATTRFNKYLPFIEEKPISFANMQIKKKLGVPSQLTYPTS